MVCLARAHFCRKILYLYKRPLLYLYQGLNVVGDYGFYFASVYIFYYFQVEDAS